MIGLSWQSTDPHISGSILGDYTLCPPFCRQARQSNYLEGTTEKVYQIRGPARIENDACVVETDVIDSFNGGAPPERDKLPLDYAWHYVNMTEKEVEQIRCGNYRGVLGAIE